MSKLFNPLSILVSALTLSACATTSKPGVDSQIKFGYANQSNISAHAITPDPDLKINTYIPADRTRVRAAREAYRKGEVKEPKSVRSLSD